MFSRRLNLQITRFSVTSTVIRLKKKERKKVTVIQSCLRNPMDYSPPVLFHFPWNSPGRNTGVGSCSLLQEIVPTQKSNQGLPHCRQIPFHLSHLGSPDVTRSKALSKDQRASKVWFLPLRSFGKGGGGRQLQIKRYSWKFFYPGALYASHHISHLQIPGILLTLCSVLKLSI